MYYYYYYYHYVCAYMYIYIYICIHVYLFPPLRQGQRAPGRDPPLLHVHDDARSEPGY